MNRKEILNKLNQTDLWDLIVIGGGSSGLGVALDAISRGFTTLLLEKSDFAQETSSRSTKLIHGGIRYLRHAHFSLIRESLKERAILLRNAPHLVRPLSFVLPVPNMPKALYYYLGIKIYDLLSLNFGIGKARFLSKKDMREKFSNPKLNRGIQYFDGQFDDSRMAINLAQTCLEQGGTVLNYISVQEFLKSNGKIVGVQAIDQETDRKFNIYAKAVVNATGAFVDRIRNMDDPCAVPIVLPSQGAHIVLHRKFFSGSSAIILPETSDGRVLFIIPWNHYVLIGTTETPLKSVLEEPKPFPEEVDFLLKHAAPYLAYAPNKSDVLSAFAGIRPLLISKNQKNASAIARDYSILISDSNLVTVVGGKWTTYRKIGEDTVDTVIHLSKWTYKQSRTKNLSIHGWEQKFNWDDEWSYYGSDECLVEKLANGDNQLLKKLHPELPIRSVDVIWSVRYEMARKLEDVLSRRTRCLLLGAKASVDIAPQVASLMARELGCDQQWANKEVEEHTILASRYMV